MSEVRSRVRSSPVSSPCLDNRYGRWSGGETADKAGGDATGVDGDKYKRGSQESEGERAAHGGRGRGGLTGNRNLSQHWKGRFVLTGHVTR